MVGADRYNVQLMIPKPFLLLRIELRVVATILGLRHIGYLFNQRGKEIMFSYYYIYLTPSKLKYFTIL